MSLSVLATFAYAPAGAQVAMGAAAIVRPVPDHLVKLPGRINSYAANWAGYAVFHRGTRFTAVRGRWTQPTATCNSDKQQYAAFWVGLDGYNSNSVEQIGTDSDCAGKNQPIYYAWFEMIPAPARYVPMAVHPGDRMVARVGAVNGRFHLILTNQTTGKSFSTTQKNSSAQRSSAEWIAEAPLVCSSGCTLAQLANFGSVDFTGSYATGGGHEGTISDTRWHRDRITMITRHKEPKAVPGPLNANGTAFSIEWKHV